MNIDKITIGIDIASKHYPNEKSMLTIGVTNSNNRIMILDIIELPKDAADINKTYELGKDMK